MKTAVVHQRVKLKNENNTAVTTPLNLSNTNNVEVKPVPPFQHTRQNAKKLSQGKMVILTATYL